nr:hypothetical protein [Tanacetum cinerariifolium]
MSNMLKIKCRLVFESTTNVENEVDELETGRSAQTNALRMRRGGASMRGACLRKTGGTDAVSCEHGSSSNNKLRTINGNIVRMRRKRDGSRAYMYSSGRKPKGFGVSCDPVDGKAMIRVKCYGYTCPAWPLGITPEDCRDHAERPKPVVLQEELVLQEQYQRRMIAQWISQQ